MFSNPASLKKRTGKFGIDRSTYLKQLIEEYLNESTDDEKKIQILANFSNFAYDPINYEYFRRLDITDIFLNILSQFHKEKFSVDLKKVQFSTGAICNLCLDEKNREFLLKNEILKYVVNCLSVQDDIEIVLNSLTILIFLFDQKTCQEISNERVKNLVTELATSNNKRVSNLAQVFLQDYLLKNQRN